MVKNLPANAGDVGLIPGLGRFPGGGNGNPFPTICKKSDMTEQLSTHTHRCVNNTITNINRRCQKYLYGDKVSIIHMKL